MFINIEVRRKDRLSAAAQLFKQRQRNYTAERNSSWYPLGEFVKFTDDTNIFVIGRTAQEALLALKKLIM